LIGAVLWLADAWPADRRPERAGFDGVFHVRGRPV
jgi:hypothetical protein